MGFSVISCLVRNEVKKFPKEISAFSFTGNCSCRISSCVSNTARASCGAYVPMVAEMGLPRDVASPGCVGQTSHSYEEEALVTGPEATPTGNH